MARYVHLQIYKTAMDAAVYVEQVVRNFSRNHKYTLGSELRQQSRELVTFCGIATGFQVKPRLRSTSATRGVSRKTSDQRRAWRDR